MASAKAVVKKGFNVSMSKSNFNAKSKLSSVGVYIAAGLYNVIMWTGIMFTAILLLVGIAYVGVVMANALLGAFGFTVLDFITMFSAIVLGIFVAGVMIFFYIMVVRFIAKKIMSKMWRVEKQDGKPILVKGDKDKASIK
jgi:hypothetical protein